MRTYTLTIAVFIALCGLFISSASFATDKSHRALGYSSSHNHHNKHLGYSNRHHRQTNNSYIPHSSHKSYSIHRNNHHYSDRGRHTKYYSTFYYSNKSQSKYSSNHDNSYRHNRYQKSCHPVSKNIIDRYGHHRKVAGTMCYNKYGQSYIVSGSRYYKH